MLYFGSDDIQIDEPKIAASTSSPDVKNKQKGKLNYLRTYLIF